MKSPSQRRVDRGVYEKPTRSGEYWIVWKDSAKRRHREHIGRSLALARAAYQKRRLEVREGKLFPESLRKRAGPLWSELCAEFKRTHPKHWSIRDGRFARVSGWWTQLSGSLISPAMIQKKLVEIEESGCTGSSANRYREIVSVVCSWAVRNGQMERNPVALVKQRRESEHRIRFLSADEETKLLEVMALVCSEHTPEVLLALHTGLRQGEQYSLRWEDVDLRASVLSVRRSKSGKPRVVHLNSVAKSALIALRRNGSPRVCPASNVRRWFPRCCEAASIENFRWHDLRHTFASRLVMAGASLAAIQGLLGHAEITTTMRYAHLAPDYGAEAVARLERFCGATSGDMTSSQDAAAGLQVVARK